MPSQLTQIPQKREEHRLQREIENPAKSGQIPVRADVIGISSDVKHIFYQIWSVIGLRG